MANQKINIYQVKGLRGQLQHRRQRLLKTANQLEGSNKQDSDKAKSLEELLGIKAVQDSDLLRHIKEHSEILEDTNDNLHETRTLYKPDDEDIKVIKDTTIKEINNANLSILIIEKALERLEKVEELPSSLSLLKTIEEETNRTVAISRDISEKCSNQSEEVIEKRNKIQNILDKLEDYQDIAVVLSQKVKDKTKNNTVWNEMAKDFFETTKNHLGRIQKLIESESFGKDQTSLDSLEIVLKRAYDDIIRSGKELKSISPDGSLGKAVNEFILKVSRLLEDVSAVFSLKKIANIFTRDQKTIKNDKKILREAMEGNKDFQQKSETLEKLRQRIKVERKLIEKSSEINKIRTEYSRYINANYSDSTALISYQDLKKNKGKEIVSSKPLSEILQEFYPLLQYDWLGEKIDNRTQENIDAVTNFIKEMIRRKENKEKMNYEEREIECATNVYSRLNAVESEMTNLQSKIKQYSDFSDDERKEAIERDLVAFQQICDGLHDALIEHKKLLAEQNASKEHQSISQKPSFNKALELAENFNKAARRMSEKIRQKELGKLVDKPDKEPTTHLHERQEERQEKALPILLEELDKKIIKQLSIFSEQKQSIIKRNKTKKNVESQKIQLEKITPLLKARSEISKLADNLEFSTTTDLHFRNFEVVMNGLIRATENTPSADMFKGHIDQIIKAQTKITRLPDTQSQTIEDAGIKKNEINAEIMNAEKLKQPFLDGLDKLNKEIAEQLLTYNRNLQHLQKEIWKNKAQNDNITPKTQELKQKINLLIKAQQDVLKLSEEIDFSKTVTASHLDTFKNTINNLSDATSELPTSNHLKQFINEIDKSEIFKKQAYEISQNGNAILLEFQRRVEKENITTKDQPEKPKSGGSRPRY